MGSKPKPQQTSSTSKTESWLTQGSHGDFLNNWLTDQFNQVGSGVPLYDREQWNKYQQDAIAGLGGNNQQFINQMGGLTGGFGQMAGAGWNQMQQGANAMSGLYGQGGLLTQQGMLDAAKGFYDSDLVGSQVNQLGTQLQDMLGGEIQALNQRAAASGGMGSSRAGVAQGVATGKAADAFASGSAQIQNAARQAALGQAMQLGQQQLGAAQGQMQFGNQMLSGAMSGIAGGIQAGNQMTIQGLMNQLAAGGLMQQEGQANKDLDRLNQMIKNNPSLAGMSQLLPFLTAMSGWNTTTNQTGTVTGGGPSTGQQLLGAGVSLGGALLGNSALFSDKRLKKNIVNIGNILGVNVYIWEWNSKALELGAEQQLNIGVIAQEVKDRFPEAVTMFSDGYYRVNYTLLLAKAVSHQIAVDAERMKKELIMQKVEQMYEEGATYAEVEKFIKGGE